MIELSKTQKKIARQLIDIGLQRECKSFTAKIEKFTNSEEWKTGDPKKLYHELYDKVISFDKRIAKRYDNLGGSRYFITVYSLFYDGVLTADDIARFDIEVQNELFKIKQLFDE